MAKRHPISRWLRGLLAAAVITTAVSQPVPAVASPAGPDAGQSLAAAPQVRLRKLHLVRPDLIQYPIAVEVYC